jgi:hypothetical protein
VAQFEIWLANFWAVNFGRIHQSLRVTPAMEAGIADHVRTLEEIIALLVKKIIIGSEKHVIMDYHPRFWKNASFLAFIAAIVVFSFVLPNPNSTNGGTVKMILALILAVIVRGVVRHFARRCRKKHEERGKIES